MSHTLGTGHLAKPTLSPSTQKQDIMHCSPWQGWLWPPSSKDPPEKPKVLQPSAKCPFRTHRGPTGDMWVSCPGQGRAVKLWWCLVPINPCFPRPGWQHLPLPLHLPAFPAASPGMRQHQGDPGWSLLLPQRRMPGLGVGLQYSCAPFHPAALAGRLVPTVPLSPPRLSSCSELHLPGDGHLLPATTRAMGQACWAVSELKALTLLGGGRRGRQRSCGGWPWPTGLWARLGTAVTIVQSLLVVQDIVSLPMLVLGPALSVLVFSWLVGSHQPGELALPCPQPFLRSWQG